MRGSGHPPAGLAAAGSQKARFSESAPSAAGLTTAGGCRAVVNTMRHGPARPEQCAAGPAEAPPPTLPRNRVVCLESVPTLRGRCPAASQPSPWRVVLADSL